MISNDDLARELMAKITEQVTADIKIGVAQTIEREISSNLSRMLIQGEFYKRINADLQDGLRAIYKEINTAKKEDERHPAPSCGEHCQPEEILSEASDQLDKILQTTEKATVEIMDVVERHLDLRAQAENLYRKLRESGANAEELDKLTEYNQILNDDLLKIMTTLSFQDLTGQRIKRIITALKKIEEIVLEAYVSTSFQIQAREAEPDRDLSEVQAAAKQKISELKGPQLNASQQSVDDLLAQLGL